MQQLVAQGRGLSAAALSTPRSVRSSSGSQRCLAVQQQPARNRGSSSSGSSRPPLLVCCSFNFAASTRAEKNAVGRRNRVIEKRHEQELRTVAHGLLSFSAKQLAAVEHLLTQQQLEQIRIGADIPKTNQGRKRQAGLVMKLLRADTGAAAMAKLAEAVAAGTQHNQLYSDRDVEQQLELWLEGLTADEPDVVSEVFGLLQAQQAQWQQFRQWVRQLQQQQQQMEQQEQQPAAAPASLGGALQQQPAAATTSAAAEQAAAEAALPVTDPEVLQLMQELAACGSPQQQQRGSKKAANSSAAAARRSIRKLLRPHAVRLLLEQQQRQRQQLEDGEDDEEE